MDKEILPDGASVTNAEFLDSEGTTVYVEIRRLPNGERNLLIWRTQLDGIILHNKAVEALQDAIMDGC